MDSYKTEIDLATLKAIIEKMNKPKYVVYGPYHLPEDQINMLKENKCEYHYVKQKILGEPENTFYVIPSEILDDYCYKMEDYYE
jgi:hypothetical protein